MTDAAAVELTVHESGSRHSGRPVAGLSESVRRQLGVLSGDTVVIAGDGAAVATVWPAGGNLPNDGVGLDEATRERAGVDVGEPVTVRAERVVDADAITVVTTGDRPDAATVRRALRDRPVRSGDRVRIDGDALRVIDVRPGGTARVAEDTTVHVRSSPTGEEPAEPAEGAFDTGVTYDDIGGLDEELELVRETIELPLADPGVFDRLGIDPPTGVLLYGPPGTGKTLIAEAVANAVDATVYHVSGPAIISKYKGESEERLREIFERARETAPSIVFFDEIDALAAERESGGDMESRVVAQLLSLMDGLEPRGNVIVIGATNRVDTLDPALRRPGRFDREIEIGVPDEAGRREILTIHANGVPLGGDVDLDDLASRTHAFVGADLRALLTEAAMTALRRTRRGDSTGDAKGDRGSDVDGVHGGAAESHAEGDGDLVVTRADIEAALAGIEPSAMREFVAETPATGFDDVGGLAEAKAALREAVEWPLAYPALFAETNTEAPSGILLYGPPGTGKTLLARAVAHETEVNFIHVAGPELLDKYVGESERAVREVFERARQAAPSIVFFDEIDALAGRRRGDEDVAERVVSQLLTELDGLADNPNLIVLAATNRMEALDPALLRPGRLETHVEVGLPDEAARREILAVHTRGKPLADDVDLDALAAALEGATGADIASVCREAAMRAIREVVADHGPDANDRADAVSVRAEHFASARAAIDRG